MTDIELRMVLLKMLRERGRIVHRGPQPEWNLPFMRRHRKTTLRHLSQFFADKWREAGETVQGCKA